MKSLDPMRDKAGVRLRTLRLRRGMSQVALAELACISPALVSMVENGQRTLSRADYIFALADALRVSPRYLTEGREDAPTGRPAPQTIRFPTGCDPIVLARHQQRAREFIRLAHQDGRATGDWLRRLAREPTVSPWLLIDQVAILYAARPGLTSKARTVR